MQIKLAIDALATIAANINGWSVPERYGAYGAFGEIDRALREQARRNNRSPVLPQLTRYRWCIEAICGLSAGRVLPTFEHVRAMQRVVEELRSDQCFGDYLEDPD